MSESFVNIRFCRWILDVRKICKGKLLETVPRC
jgi:hypothetical protein